MQGEFGQVVDAREWMTELWAGLRAAQAIAAMTERAIWGPLRPAQYIGPLKRGWWLEPRTAEELAELLARGVVIAEGVMDPEGRVGFGRSERAEPRKGVSPGRRE